MKKQYEQAQILQVFLLDDEFAALKRPIFFLSLLGVVPFAPMQAKGLVWRSES